VQDERGAEARVDPLGGGEAQPAKIDDAAARPRSREDSRPADREVLAVDVPERAQEGDCRRAQPFQGVTERRSRRIAEVGEDRVAARMPERFLGRRDRGVRRREEEGIHRLHESRRRVFRQGGARTESGQEREGEESPAREERSGTPVSSLHARGYAAVEPQIERSSHADGVSSHSLPGESPRVESERRANSADERALANDEVAGAGEQSLPCHSEERFAAPGVGVLLRNFGGEAP
jgi:hypothetical protein